LGRALAVSSLILLEAEVYVPLVVGEGVSLPHSKLILLLEVP
jgi:hypothetical protein